MLDWLFITRLSTASPQLIIVIKIISESVVVRKAVVTAGEP